MSEVIRRLLLIVALVALPLHAEATKLIPMGDAIHIELQLGAIYAMHDIQLKDGASIAKGDRLIALNGRAITKLADLQPVKGRNIVTVAQGDQTKDVALDAKEVQTMQPFLKDATDGNGTLTYVDPHTAEFGALGHQIIDASLQRALPFTNSYIYFTSISQLKKSKPGLPGYKVSSAIKGDMIGHAEHNAVYGIFGRLTAPLQNSVREPLEIIQASEIELGEATMYTVIDGDEVEPFTIHIDAVQQQTIQFTVMDEKLLAATGGVIQGMSGSPIIQNNYFIGAVTHMYVENPRKGTAISITEMGKK